MNRYCVIDFETTGLSPTFSEVVEFAAVRVEQGEVGLYLTSLCRPHRPIPPGATKIHGITNEMVRVYAPFAEYLPTLLAFIDKDTVVAHNIPFDMGFLNRYCHEAKTPFAPKLLCTLRMARERYPFLHSRSLSVVAAHAGIQPPEDYHRALGDAMTTARLLIHMLTENKEETI